MDVYHRIYNEIRSAAGHVRVRESYDFPAGRSIKIIKVAAECNDIVDKLPTLKIDLEGGVSLEIDPRGYVYPPVPGDEYCKLGLSGVEGSKQYRLGTQFMKNFYTVLDYDNKKIMLGAKGTHATISGDESLVWQPPKPDPLPEPTEPTQDDTTGSKTDDETTKPDADQGSDDTTKPDEEEPTEPKDDDKEPEQPDEKPEPTPEEPAKPDEEPKDEPKDDQAADDKPVDPPVDKPTDDKPEPADKDEQKPAPTPVTPTPPAPVTPAPAPAPAKKKGVL